MTKEEIESILLDCLFIASVESIGGISTAAEAIAKSFEKQLSESEKWKRRAEQLYELLVKRMTSEDMKRFADLLQSKRDDD